jgi:hypothetical protein
MNFLLQRADTCPQVHQIDNVGSFLDFVHVPVCYRHITKFREPYLMPSSCERYVQSSTERWSPFLDSCIFLATLFTNICNVCEIWVSRGGEDNNVLQGCCAVCTQSQVDINVSEKHSLHHKPWRWRQYVSPKCWHLPTSLHVVTTLKINIAICGPNSWIFFKIRYIVHTHTYTQKTDRVVLCVLIISAWSYHAWVYVGAHLHSSTHLRHQMHN